MQFGEHLRSRRKDLGLRQEDVAADAGITYITYGDYERGKCFPKDTTLRMLCNVLKLDYEQMYAAMVESKRLGDIAKAERRARAGKRLIWQDQWEQKESAADVERNKTLHLELQLPSLAITGNLSDDGTIHGQLQASDVRLFLGEEWKSVIAAQTPVGRLAEYQLLCHLAKQAQDGRGQVVSIVGTAGIGKSYLLSAICKYLENQRFTVVEASCRENVDDVPYYPFAILLDALSEDKSLAEKWKDELPLLRRLLPSKLQTMQEKLWPYSPLTEEQRHQMLINNLLRALTMTAQRRPLAIIIEDTHWMDKPSKKLMRILAGQLNAHRVYLLLAYRPQLKAPWVYAKNHTQLWLSPLSEQHLESVLAEQLEPGQLAPEERDWIYQKTGGNPFYAKELVRELIDGDALIRRTRWWKFSKEKELLDIAEELEQVLAHRLARIPEDHKPFLKYAATLGSPFSEAQAQIAVGKSSDASLEVLEKADIVHYESKAGIYHFAHDLTQEAAYNIIPQAERAHWHRQVAKTLESTSETVDLETSLKLADHYMNAGEMSKTAEYLLKAATEARKFALSSEAQSYLQRALDLLDASTADTTILRLRLDVLEQLDIVEEYIGNHRQRKDYIEEALRLCRRIEASPRRRASLYHQLADVYGYLENRTEKIRAAKEGLALLASEPPCLESLELWHTLAGAYRDERMKTEMWEALKQELKIAESGGALNWLTTATRQHASILQAEGKIHQAIERYMHAYDLVLKANNAGEQRIIALELANCWESIGELEKAFQWYERGFTIAEKIYHVETLDIYKFALLALRTGMNQEAAEQHLIRAVELTGKMGFVQRQAQANALLGRFYCHQGRWSQARQRLEEAVVQLSDIEIDNHLVSALGFLEWSLANLGEQEAFPPLCLKLRQHVQPNPKIPQQWHLMPTFPISDLADEGEEVFIDRFDGGKLAQRWRFQMGRDDAYYKLSEEGGLILHAPHGCDLFPLVNMDAPRLVQELSGDFALEVEIENLPQEPIQAGGILLWQDDNHFFRFERGLFGPNELRFGYVCGEEKPRMIRIGRGFLDAKSYRLRLERIGNRVRASVKGDKEQWLSCGEYEISLRDLLSARSNARLRLSVGFYALCPDVLSEFYPKVDVSALWVKAFRIICYNSTILTLTSQF